MKSIEDVVIIGAGPAGLAVAKCLKDHGIRARLVDAEETIGSSWRRHYDRLHLHTANSRSFLPGMKIPRNLAQYIPRARFVQYLDDYADKFDLEFTGNCNVQSVSRQCKYWHVTCDHCDIFAHHVVMATGFAQEPKYGDWPGLKSFPGKVLHTRFYKNPADLPGQRVLVVGFGNSGGEIAIDLVEDGRDVEIAVRSKVNLLPKELLGIPIGNFDFLPKLIGHRLADRLNAPLLRWVMGDYEQYGLRKADVGPLTDVIENNRVPLIDIGTLDLMRAGKLRARTGISHIEGQEVFFDDGTSGTYDAILMATGYRVDLRPLLGEMPEALDETGRPHKSGAEIASGLWAISYHAVSNGQINAIAQQAPVIADGIASA